MRKFAILMLMSASAVLQAQEATTRPPVVANRTDPAYTDEALAARIQGTVILQLMIGTDGIASDIHVVRGLGYGLDDKAVECVEAWRFRPALRNGEPVETKAQVEINFRLPPGK